MANAYIDPGSGGYLISSLLAMLGGFFAFISASAIYIFRNVFGKFVRFAWQKHRLLLILVIVSVVGAGVWLLLATHELTTPPKFNPPFYGAHLLDTSRVSPGYNLYGGKLIDMQGRVLKEWPASFLGALDQNGDYYSITIDQNSGRNNADMEKLGRYTWDGKTVWEKNLPVHHEILITPKGTIITFIKEVHEYLGRYLQFDVILEFDKYGNELQRFSFWEHLKELQQYHHKLEFDTPFIFSKSMGHKKNRAPGVSNDYYHLNSLSFIPENRLQGVDPAFRPGNWLICLRHGSMIFILDQDTKKVLWHAIDDQVKGRLEGPHAPVMLPSGQILIFDNGRYRKWSRLIEIDPRTLKIVWEYRHKDFFSIFGGDIQKLPNGNLLVTETVKGHVFELTWDKKIVWEYYHSGRIDMMKRYPPEMIEPLLHKK